MRIETEGLEYLMQQKVRLKLRLDQDMEVRKHTNFQGNIIGLF